jgi:hypothetical protein
MLTATELRQRLEGLSLDAREAIVAAALDQGAVPDFLLALRELKITGGAVSATLLVSPDYLSIGTETDFVRMPMYLDTARAWMKGNGYALPTRRVMHEAWRQADVRLPPKPWGPPYVESEMTTLARYWTHNAWIEGQLGATTAPLNRELLVAGHKKDLICSPQQTDANIVIGGWTQPNGLDIQPAFAGHHRRWVDYSQCFRLVADKVRLGDGTEASYAELLDSPTYASLLSDEGRFKPRW